MRATLAVAVFGPTEAEIGPFDATFSVRLPLLCSVLYFDTETGALQAIDSIDVGGVTQADISTEREILTPP